MSRQEFEDLRLKAARDMDGDGELKKKALEVLAEADRYHWIHQTTWFGEPILNLPQDMFALQEIIYRTRPDFIVEAGVAWGGSLLFYATLMEVLGGKGIIGIDIYIPEDLRERIAAKGPLARRITLLEASSIEESTRRRVRAIIGDTDRVMVVLDSNHTHNHVLAELRMYSPLVGMGHYLVCGDTVIEDMPPDAARPRPWGRGNNPKTALGAFLAETDAFEVDEALGRKLLFTCNPGGFLRRVR